MVLGSAEVDHSLITSYLEVELRGNLDFLAIRLSGRCESSFFFRLSGISSFYTSL